MNLKIITFFPLPCLSTVPSTLAPSTNGEPTLISPSLETKRTLSKDTLEPSSREQFVSQIIREILNEKDVLLTNVKVSFEGKNTELDNVIINNRGVFIIEVKNYSGILIGDEDDFEWIKNKYTEAGNFYQKSVKNPIKQIKRQVYILSGYLKAHGFDVWIEGYVFFVEGNSPINSKYILNTQKDINTVIHFGINNKLKKVDKEKIVEFIS